MAVSEKGYVTRSEDDGRTRVFTRDGSYVDIDPDMITTTERLADDDSGLAVWAIEHTDPRATHGALADDALDRLFITDVDSPLADIAAAPTKWAHCPATVPRATCEESRFGHCYP